MSLEFWCLLVAIIFPYFFCALAKTSPGFNNQNPRETLEHLKGWRRRAHWVQLNSFEILPAFAAAVIIGHQFHADSAILGYLSLGFILLRIIYAVCYIMDKQMLRSLTWVLGLGVVIVMYLFSTLNSDNRSHYGFGMNAKDQACMTKGTKFKSGMKHGVKKGPRAVKPAAHGLKNGAMNHEAPHGMAKGGTQNEVSSQIAPNHGKQHHGAETHSVQSHGAENQGLINHHAPKHGVTTQGALQQSN